MGPGARFPSLCSASDDFLSSSSVQDSTRIEVPFHLRPDWWWDLDLGLSVWGFLLRGFHRRTSRLSCCNNNNSCNLINNCWEDWKIFYLNWPSVTEIGHTLLRIYVSFGQLELSFCFTWNLEDRLLCLFSGMLCRFVQNPLQLINDVPQHEELVHWNLLGDLWTHSQFISIYISLYWTWH